VRGLLGYVLYSYDAVVVVNFVVVKFVRVGGLSTVDIFNVKTL
jgi:hypothetical protein